MLRLILKWELEGQTMRFPVTGALATAVILAAGLSLSGCATEEYVDEHIAAVNGRIDTVSGQVNGLGTRVDAVERLAQNNQQQIAALNTGKFVYSESGQTTSVEFATNSAALSDEAKATLTSLAESLKSANKGVYLEISGHGDPRGSVALNRELGAKRSLEVRRFLYAQGVPMNRMDVVSWGEERATGQNSSAEELQKDRRVDVTVLS
jgi:outer membrane protein OmpA-like peptidoglycan-associated protein